MVKPGETKIQLVTTDGVPGRETERSLGMVTGHVILGANFVRDFFANVRDFVGGRAGAYEHELRKAERYALEEIANTAAEAGANAVVGISVDYESLNRESSSLLMVVATGTAVVVR